MNLISIVTGCYNEADNVQELYERITKVMSDFVNYNYEVIFIDNASIDNTVSILKKIADKNKNVKIIINSRNFGHIRSPYYALLQSKGDVAITIASDLQDPPELLKEFIQKWEEGYIQAQIFIFDFGQFGASRFQLLLQDGDIARAALGGIWRITHAGYCSLEMNSRRYCADRHTGSAARARARRSDLSSILYEMSVSLSNFLRMST